MKTIYQVTTVSMDALADSTDAPHDLVAMLMEPSKLCSTYFRALDAVVKMMNDERKARCAQGTMKSWDVDVDLTALKVQWEETTGEHGSYTYTTDPLTGTAYQIHETQVDA